ncbi:protein mono-ADP-ribosyltransferase PARP12-like isoform X2 [Conger conger]|uniref:protein mono-ADP-ribosyltransferase PARP12-like isoform X2 n=1 Tax=Conger conger TaxID=82655 RepID=UPI002A5A37DF|nr:protein mono-ADP-ribosyltransferase PARP12-like isoform X2 [Conger conger]
MAEASVIKVICANSGAMDYGDLVHNILSGDETAVKKGDVFHVAHANGNKRIIAKTKVRLCKARECDGCNNLHLCKFFLYGVCKNNRGRRVCRFGHSLTTEHNARVLSENSLQTLDQSELCTLLLQNDGTLLPPVCFSYNKGDGEYGNCPDQESCRRLHICDRYLRGACQAGANCRRSHDFFEPHPQKTLQERGVPSELIGSMLSVYQNIQALKNSDPNKANPRAQTHGANGSQRTAEQPENGPEKTEICMYYIRGSCKHNERCWREHSKLPYKWEVKVDFGWSALQDNEQLEEDFCDPSKECSRGFPVQFQTMTRGPAQVRRLSTVSSVVQPTFVLTTTWAWYWQDEHGRWVQYSSSAGGHSASSISSEVLEDQYQKDSAAVVQFTAGSQTYQISFRDMVQRNLRYGTARDVRRRPVFVSPAEVRVARTRRAPSLPTSNFQALPSHWDKTAAPETELYKKISVQPSTKEYQDVLALFNTTMRGFRVRQIERIQNRSLWEVFQWQKGVMAKNNEGRNVTERQLFHGTESKHMDAICKQNFDWRICGTHGTAYGKGSYFARDAKYSHNYTGASGVRTMFVCRVLVGCYTRGDSSYLRPPSKDGGDSVFYDSCVDNIHNPSIFVVFEKHQIYPEYLIRYCEDEWDSPVRASYVPPKPAQVHYASTSYARTSSASYSTQSINTSSSNTESSCVIS